MKKPENSNIYEYNALSVLAKYESFIVGDPNDLVLVLTMADVSQALKNAVEKSAEALGLGVHSCAYVRIVCADGRALLPDELFELIEGIDPVSIVSADSASSQLMLNAYKTETALFAEDEVRQVFTRPTALFHDLESLLLTNEGKQKAWHLFKSAFTIL